MISVGMAVLVPIFNGPEFDDKRCWEHMAHRTFWDELVIRFIEADGWRLVSIKGSHRQFKHPFKRGRVTIAGKLDMELHPKTLKSILRQADIEDIVDD